MTDAKTALATRRENGDTATNSLADQIRSMQDQYQLAMPRGVEATQLIRDALTALRMTKNLNKCDSASVLGSLMTCAQLGLRPGVLGHAWLVPFWNRKLHKNPDGSFRGGYQAQLVIGYQGLVELAYRSGKVSSITARTVFENDVFEVAYGLADDLVHRPCLDGSKGKPVAYYAVVKLASGGHAFYVMTHTEMIDYRDQHATAKNRDTGKVFGPWVDSFEGMAHKTCVRQLAKWMPKATELANALVADEGVRVDLTPTADAAEVTVPVDADSIDGEVVEDESDG